MKPSTTIAFERLHNLHLFGNPAGSPENAVQSLVAIQAQDFSATKWGLGVRSGTTDLEVESAFCDGRILRTHVLRPTWHFVVPDDIRWLLALSAPRVLAASALQFRKLELDATVFDKSIKVFRKALRGGRQLTREGLRALLEKAGVVTHGELRLSHILMQAELHAVICSGARDGKHFTYALLDDRAPDARALDANDGLVELAARFFVSRGPASIQDFAKWSWLTLTACRQGLEGCKSRLEERKIDGVSYWSTPGINASEPVQPVAHLLSIYDEYVSSYKDRGAIGRAVDGPKLVAMGNALTGIVLVNGQIVGSWKRTQKKSEVAVDVKLLRKLSKTERAAVVVTAEQYAAFNNKKLQLKIINS
ncbi:MAG: winged helix DNA-binding domain-containing protein [Gemmatimonadaceae bacterium]